MVSFVWGLQICPNPCPSTGKKLPGPPRRRVSWGQVSGGPSVFPIFEGGQAMLVNKKCFLFSFGTPPPTPLRSKLGGPPPRKSVAFFLEGRLGPFSGFPFLFFVEHYYTFFPSFPSEKVVMSGFREFVSGVLRDDPS